MLLCQDARLVGCYKVCLNLKISCEVIFSHQLHQMSQVSLQNGVLDIDLRDKLSLKCLI